MHIEKRKEKDTPETRVGPGSLTARTLVVKSFHLPLQVKYTSRLDQKSGSESFCAHSWPLLTITFLSSLSAHCSHRL